MVRVTSNKKYTCHCCKNKVDITGIGSVNGCTIVCSQCLPTVTKREKELTNTFIYIHGKSITHSHINSIRKLALEINI